MPRMSELSFKHWAVAEGTDGQDSKATALVSITSMLDALARMQLS